MGSTGSPTPTPTSSGGAATAVPRYEHAPFGPSRAAVEFDQSGHATLRFCSWRDAGWRSILLRRFESRREVDEVAIPAVGDQLLMLVTHGEKTIESSDGGRWRRAGYAPGRLALTAPDRACRLRWQCLGDAPQRNLHVHLPGRVLAETAERVWGRGADRVGLPDALVTEDPVVEGVMRSLDQAAAAAADDLYAESALTFLAVHLLSRHAGLPGAPEYRGDDVRVRRAVEFMHDNLHLPLRLADIADSVGLSPFHFARLFRGATGEPPRRRLNRMRIDAAAGHLSGRLTVTEIAFRCGFSSASHLSVAFHRHHGVTPTQFRRQQQR